MDRHPTFVAVVNAMASTSFNYKPPSYNALQTTLIGFKKLEVEAEVKRVTSFLTPNCLGPRFCLFLKFG